MKPGIVNLPAQARATGAKASDRLREEFSVPAVLYGPTVEENTNLAVSELALEKILAEPRVQFIDLDLDGTTHRVIVKNVDFHPVTDRPIHADFLLLSDEHEVGLTVPVMLKGVSPGVIKGGRLYQSMRKMRIKGLPASIPALVEIDISGMDIGATVKIKDLELGDVKPMEPLSTTIVVVNPLRGGAKNIKG
jgi:large subunit ribosomal protein L25